MLKMSSLRLAALFGLAALLSGSATPQPVKTSLAPMPEAVTSFGAVTSDGWLYVFGGHKGERHEYSTEMVSGSFHRLKLSDGSAWEKLPSAAPGQGQPLVAYNGYVYRIGGMAAKNHEKEKQDLFSTTIAQRYNPETKKWEDFTKLPAPRSSHDAVVKAGKLYVIGGWQLAGGASKPVWPANALVLDLAHPEAGWKEFPQPFQRRAIAVAATGSRLYCIGGMDSDNKTTLAVEVYDISTGKWTKGPDLPPGPNKGFSCSAISLNGQIYANALQGDLLRLSKDGNSWDVVGRVDQPRLAHRLVTAGKTQLIVLGGEDGDAKRPELQLLTPSAKPLPAKATSSSTNQAAAHAH